jgi:trypsin-like peptidase
MRTVLDIEGTGFLVAPQMVQTCAHVVDAILYRQKKQGPRPFIVAVQFVYRVKDGQWRTGYRGYQVVYKNDDLDLALLKLDGTALPPQPVRVVSHGNHVPSVGDKIALCGYAHGKSILVRGKTVERFGPVIQAGIVAALSPFDTAEPDVVVLDLVTGPAASGSPVFYAEGGEIFGYLTEGQIKGTAALSFARIIYRDAQGRVTSNLRQGLEVTKVQLGAG